MNNFFAKHDMQAIRALRRLIEIKFDGFDEFIAADRAFDCGEWSDAHIERQQQLLEDECIHTVADRFGYTDWGLGELWMNYEYVHDDMYRDAVTARGDQHARQMAGFDLSMEN